MNELIKREDAINAMAELQGIAQSKAELTGISKAWKRIKALPTVDAVPVCRCKDCKYNIGEKVWLNGEVTIDCANGMGYPPPNWFCADGERKEQERE